MAKQRRQAEGSPERGRPALDGIPRLNARARTFGALCPRSGK